MPRLVAIGSILSLGALPLMLSGCGTASADPRTGPQLVRVATVASTATAKMLRPRTHTLQIVMLSRSCA